VAGRAEPQQHGQFQAEQYALSVSACVNLARTFLAAGYDVAIDDVLTPDAFARDWQPLLEGLDWRVVIVLPTLVETLRRSRGRTKRVFEQHTVSQHRASEGWPASQRVDTTGLTVSQSLELARACLERRL
jgi:chloramphenicol 3-O-phosphotransferase